MLVKLIDLSATIQSFLNSNLFGSLIVKSALEFAGKNAFDVVQDESSNI